MFKFIHTRLFAVWSSAVNAVKHKPRGIQHLPKPIPMPVPSLVGFSVAGNGWPSRIWTCLVPCSEPAWTPHEIDGSALPPGPRCTAAENKTASTLWQTLHWAYSGIFCHAHTMKIGFLEYIRRWYLRLLVQARVGKAFH
jgi:hypothetical protein